MNVCNRSSLNGLKKLFCGLSFVFEKLAIFWLSILSMNVFYIFWTPSSLLQVSFHNYILFPTKFQPSILLLNDPSSSFLPNRGCKITYYFLFHKIFFEKFLLFLKISALKPQILMNDVFLGSAKIDTEFLLNKFLLTFYC